MINFKHVYKTYGGSRHALRDINFNIDQGEFVFLIGPSGAGKTTLFKLISAYERISTGHIHVINYDIENLRVGQIPFYRRKIGFVFQDFKLLKNKTIFENIALPLQILNTSSNEIKTRVNEIMLQVGLTGYEDQYPDFLSGGEQQRVAIARALIHRPELLIADEPTGNLDPKLSENILQLFFEFSTKGTTFIMATHDHRLLNHKKCRVLELDKGNLVSDRST